MEPARTRFTATPYRAVSLMRHSIAMHNEAAAIYGENAVESVYLSEVFADSSLSERGHAMLHSVRKALSGLSPPPDIVLTSPLTRAIQTAVSIFHGTEIPIVAVPDIREAYGRFPCDRHRDKDDLMGMFGGEVDFRLVEEKDMEWTADHREDMAHLGNRAAKFVETLFQRKEGHLFVVSHGVFLEAVIRHLLMSHPAAKMFLEKNRVQSRVHNCEVHTFVFSDPTTLRVGKDLGLPCPQGSMGGAAGVTVSPGLWPAPCHPQLECYLDPQSLGAVCASGIPLMVVGHLGMLFWRFARGRCGLDKGALQALLAGCSLTPQEMKWVFCSLDREGEGLVAFEDLLLATIAFYTEGASGPSPTLLTDLRSRYQRESCSSGKTLLCSEVKARQHCKHREMSGTPLADPDTLAQTFRHVVATILAKN